MNDRRPETAGNCDEMACATGPRGFVAAVRDRLEALATADADPRRTAAALALGVFLSFSPLLGLQIVIGVSAALVLRLSRVALFVGLCANLPWIMIPYYALTTGAAAVLLGRSVDADFTARLGNVFAVPMWQSAFWGRGADLLAAFFWPFLIGPFAGAAILAGVAYVVGLRFLRRVAQRRALAATGSGLAGNA